MIEVKGKSGIVAKIICDSVSEQGIRITTFELQYPRMVHSEILTHRMLSRNSASSRAIPFEKMAEQLTARPVRFGAANKGMQDTGEDFKELINIEDYSCSPQEAWNEARYSATAYSNVFKQAGYHKQIFNRLTEPFQMIKTVVTATEWSNFFWLRNDSAADPTLQELARCMQEAYNKSEPMKLRNGEWHLPYVDVDYFSYHSTERQHFYEDKKVTYTPDNALSLQDAIKVSAARCAAVSYRNEDYTLEKCLHLYERLVGDERKHASALEHQATPIKLECNGYYKRENLNVARNLDSWQEGISHVDREGNFWSGNFKNWVQHRKTIKGENYE